MGSKSYKKTTYVFIDESGKPEVFSAKGKNLVKEGHASKFLVICAVRSCDQLSLQRQITDFKSQLLNDKELTKIFSSSYALDNFHANHDYPEVKERFYQFITTLKIKIDVLAVDKLKCYYWLQREPGRLYGFMCGQLLKHICHQAKSTEIIFSRKDSKLKLRQELEIEVERVRLNYLQKNPDLKTDFKLQYFYNPHYTHGGLQIADYIAYAVFKLFEVGDDKYYKIIKNKIGRIHDICNKKYFTQRNPLQLST